MTEALAPQRAQPREPALLHPCGSAPEPGHGLEVAPGVFWLRVPLPAGKTVNSWALRDGEGWTVVDTGMRTEPAVEAWRHLLSAQGPLAGRPVTRVIATHLHADHVGMAGWLCSTSGADLWMTRGEYLQARLLQTDSDQPPAAQDLAFYRRAGWEAPALDAYRPMGRNMSPIPSQYRRLRDADRIRIGGDEWQVVVGSGHSPEHACLHCPDRGLFISGDQVLPLISSNVSVWPLEPQADAMGEWLASIDRIHRSVPDDVLVLPAHDDPFHGLHARLDQLASKRHRALDLLREALGQRSLRAVDAFEPLFRRREFENVFVQQLATGEAVAYLNHLVQRGQAVVREDQAGVAWYAAPQSSKGSQP